MNQNESNPDLRKSLIIHDFKIILYYIYDIFYYLPLKSCIQIHKDFKSDSKFWPWICGREMVDPLGELQLLDLGMRDHDFTIQTSGQRKAGLIIVDTFEVLVRTSFREHRMQQPERLCNFFFFIKFPDLFCLSQRS